jgi:hypothetical protein
MSGQIGAMRQARLRAEDVHLQHITRARTSQRDRPGEQVRARPALDARVHQQVGRVAGVMGERLDLHQVTRGHGQHRCEVGIEVTPVHGLRRRRQRMQARAHAGTADSMNARQPP